MKRIFKYFLLLILIDLNFTTLLYAPGFVTGTLVRTPGGCAQIEQLSISDQVVCCSPKKRAYANSVITDLKSQFLPELIQIKIADELISAAPDQLFFVQSEARWCFASDLDIDQTLLSDRLGEVKIQNIKKISQVTKFFDFRIADRRHSFCVGQHGILVHNWAFVLGAAYVFGEGWVFSASAALLGFLGITLVNSKHKWHKPNVKVNPEKMGDYLNFGSGGSSDPEKEPDEDQKNKKSNKSSKQKNSTELQSKERKQNKISKSEFSKDIKNSYQKLRNRERWKKNPKAEGFKDAEYLEWDKCHQDIEAYNKRGEHTGSIDPATGRYYKPRVIGRTIDI